MPGLTRNTQARQKGGGIGLVVLRVQRNATTGVIEAFTGTTDELGGAAGTFHDIVSFESSSLKRDDQGVWTIDGKFVELDLTRRNLLIKMAPYVADAASKPEELDLEDGTVLESASGTTEDSDLPLWQVYKHEASDPTTGDATAYVGVMQVKRSGGWDNKANSYTKPGLTLYSVDAEGWTPTKPTAGTFTWIDGLTPTALTGPTAMGEFLG